MNKPKIKILEVTRPFATAQVPRALEVDGKILLNGRGEVDFIQFKDCAGVVSAIQNWENLKCVG